MGNYFPKSEKHFLNRSRLIPHSFFLFPDYDKETHSVRHLEPKEDEKEFDSDDTEPYPEKPLDENAPPSDLYSWDVPEGHWEREFTYKFDRYPEFQYKYLGEIPIVNLVCHLLSSLKIWFFLDRQRKKIM